MTTPLLSSASLALGLVVHAKAGVSILKEYLALALGVEIVECEESDCYEWGRLHHDASEWTASHLALFVVLLYYDFYVLYDYAVANETFREVNWHRNSRRPRPNTNTSHLPTVSNEPIPLDFFPFKAIVSGRFLRSSAGLASDQQCVLELACPV
jgi:hypothetical protein